MQMFSHLSGLIGAEITIQLFFARTHDDVIKLKHLPRYWPFVQGIHRWPVNSPHKGQWRGALMFSLICAWLNGWVNNREAGDLWCHRAHYGVIVTFLANRVLMKNLLITVSLRICVKWTPLWTSIEMLRPRQNARYFTNVLFSIEYVWILVKFHWSSEQIMVWRLSGDKPLIEPIMA